MRLVPETCSLSAIPIPWDVDENKSTQRQLIINSIISSRLSVNPGQCESNTPKVYAKTRVDPKTVPYGSEVTCLDDSPVGCLIPPSLPMVSAGVAIAVYQVGLNKPSSRTSRQGQRRENHLGQIVRKSIAETGVRQTGQPSATGRWERMLSRRNTFTQTGSVSLRRCRDRLCTGTWGSVFWTSTDEWRWKSTRAGGN